MSTTFDSNQIPDQLHRVFPGNRYIDRPRDEVPTGMPVALRSVFNGTFNRGRFRESWSKRFVVAKWVVSGQAMMGHAGHRTPFGPGEVAIYLPSSQHQFWTLEEVNELWWFTMDGPMAEQFVLDLGLRVGVHRCGPIPVSLLERMMESIKDHSIQGRRKSSLLAIETWYEIANSIHAPENPSEVWRAKHIIQQEFADPDLSAESLAGKLHYHRGSLSRMFHKHTGVTIIDYITDVRLQAARSLLQHTDEKISEIARKCGFREATYFCSWLKKHTGTTPKELRIASHVE